MDALDVLIADHNRCRGLFARLKEAKEAGNDAEQASLVELICEELRIHMQIEEELVYPEIERLTQGLVANVDEGVEEHHVAKVLMDEIRDLVPGDDDWTAKVTVLRESVEHHIEEEESDLFPHVRSQTDADTRRTLGEQITRMRVAGGGPDPAMADDLTLEELHDKASEQQIPGRSTMDRDELVATIDPR